MQEKSLESESIANNGGKRSWPARETITEHIPITLVERLKEVSRGAEVPLALTISVAYHALLYRYAGEEDSSSTPSGQNAGLASDDIAAFFANSDFSSNPTFRQVLRQLQTVSSRRTPGDLPGRSRTLPFQVRLALGNAPRPPFPLPLVDLRSFGASTTATDCDFEFAVGEDPEGLVCTAEYATDLFAANTIRRFLDHYRTLLEGVAENPNQGLADLPLLPASERKLILEQWNDTRVDYAEDLCLHQLVERQVEKTPDAPALRFESHELTYRELNARANQLAHHLRKLGVGPDVMVGISAERSIEMVVGLLGIIKAGGAYVPLDPEHPRERLAMEIEDAAPVVLLAQEKLLPGLPSQGVPVICLDRDWHRIATEPSTNPECITTGKDQVYTIFTSGSTGKPKGVPNVHEGIVNRLLWGQHSYPLTSSDRVVQKTPYSFDVSVWEFFWPLISGACLVLARPHGHKDPNYLVRLIVEQGITTSHFVPAMLRIFLEAENVEQCTSLRQVFCSGEALPFELQQRFFRRLKAELHNLYGPTEASVEVTYWHCRPDSGLNVVPIGRPIWNTQMYILDKRLNPVPIGVPAELHIGGINLARGYLKRPQLTEERFIRDPFRRDPGARLYKTGDLARFLPDGAIEYLGRIDHQIKIHGIRIELGEIEKVLESDPSIRQSVVLALVDPSGEKRLVAYVLPRESPHGAAATGQEQGPKRESCAQVHPQQMATRELVSQFRQFARTKLPEYMVPSAFLIVDSIPLTGSGKVNRRALPPPDWSRPEGQIDYVPPQTPVEESIARIFAEVLKVERVGREDNFFEIGGHSLSAAEVASRLAQILQVDVQPRVIFESPTVASLGLTLGGMERNAPTTDMPSIVAGTKRQGVPLSIAQEALWYEHQLDPGSPAYNIPLLSRLHGSLDVAAFEKALLVVVDRHEVLRSVILTSGGAPLLFPLKKWRGSLQQVDLRHLSESDREQEAERLVKEESARPFELSRDALLRCVLIRLAEHEWLFLHNSPHIVFDGGSLAVFYRELAASYEGFRNGRSPEFPELPFQFADFAAWQRRLLQGTYLESLSNYWRQQLTDAPTVEMPLDFPRPAVRRFPGKYRFFTIPEDLLAAAHTFLRSAGTTAFRGLYATFNIFLHCYTGLEDICVGSPVAPLNPACQGVENLIGYFVNTVVLRTDVTGDPSFRQVIRRAEAVVDGAMAHSDLPFNKVVAALQLTRDLGRPILFQINFRVVSQRYPRLQLEHVAADAAVDVDTGTSKFDLALEIEPTSGACCFEYRTDLFRPESIAQMERDFQALLRGLIARPDTPLSRLPEVVEISRRTGNRTAALASPGC